MRSALTVVMFKRLDRSTVALLSVVALALCIRLALFVGPAEVDDYNYARYAYEISKGDFSLPDVEKDTGWLQRFRFAILLPVALSFATFGVSDLATVLWPLLCSLGSTTLAFCLGKQIQDESVGLLAALLYALFPLDIVYATRLLPEAILPFFTGLSVLFFAKADASSAKREMYFLFALSGIMLGIAYFVRVLAALILLFFVVYTVYRRKLRREYFIPIVILSVLILAEASLYYLKNDDFLLRFRQLQADNAHWRAMGMNAPPGYYIEQAFTNNLLKHPALLVSLAAVCLVLSKQATAAVPLLWMIPSFMFLEYAPVYKEARFLSVVTMPAVLTLSICLCSLMNAVFCRRLVLVTACVFLLLLAFKPSFSLLLELSNRVTTPSLAALTLVVGLTLRNRRVRWSTSSLVVLLLGIACFGPSSAQAQRFLSWEGAHRETFQRLSDLPVRTLCCGDAYTSIKLDYLYRYSQRCKTIEDIEHLSAIDTGYLVVDLRRESSSTLVKELPSNWTEIDRVLAGRDTPQIAIYGAITRRDAEKEARQLEQNLLARPLDAVQHHVLGNDYAVMDRWEDAVNIYAQAVARYPTDTRTRSRLIATSTEYVKRGWESIGSRDNLLTNASFEQGAAGWQMHRSSGESAVFAIDKEDSSAEAHIGLIEGLTHDYHGGWYQRLQLRKNAPYLFSCRVRIQDEQGMQGKILYWEGYANGQTSGHWAEEFSGSMDWMQKWVILIAPDSDGDFVSLYPVLVTGRGTVSIDDALLIELGESVLTAQNDNE